MLDDSANGDNVVHRGRPTYESGFGLYRLAQSLRRNTRLVAEMSRRELTAMHSGQMAGAVWLVVHPLLQFVIYAFLFTIVFKVRIGTSGPTDYLLYLFSGLTPWLLTQDCLVRSTNVMIAN